MTRATVALQDEVLVVRDVEDTPTTAVSLSDVDVECIGVSPGAPERVFVGTFEDGLYRSTDGGGTFDALETDFVSDAVMSLAISPHDPDVVYAGTEPSRVYRSKDGGDCWENLGGITDLPSEDEWYFPPRPDTHHVRWLTIDTFDPDRLYVGIEAGAFVLSEDGGKSWKERPPGSRRDNHSIATHPDRKGRVYSAAGDGFAVSDDGGKSWSTPQEGLEHRYCWSVVPDPGDPERILVSSASGARTAHTASRAKSYVYRRNGTGPWKRLDGRGLPMGNGVVRAVLATTGQTAQCYAVSNRGLFRTDDFGDSWSPVPIDWPEKWEGQTPRGLSLTD